MNFDETLTRFQETNPDDLLEALSELEALSINAFTETSKARDAYFADAAQKKATVDARIEALIKQRNQHQAKIDAFNRSLVTATVAGDNKKMDCIRADLKECESTMLQVSTEIEMLQSAHIPGDMTLYNEVVAKNNTYQDLRTQYRTAKHDTWEFARGALKRWERIKDATHNYDMGGGFDLNMEALNAHYRAMYNHNTDTNKIAEEPKPRNLHTNTYTFGGTNYER